LYLPEEWCHDAERRAQAKVPADVSFQAKPEQAMAMLEQAWHAGVPMRWVTGDEVYGDATELRDLVARNGRWYVLAVRTPTPVWLQRQRWSRQNRRSGGARVRRCVWRMVQQRRRP
jgi:SRSO17 transposase